MGSDFVSFGVVIAIVIGLSQWVKEKAALTGTKAEVAALAIGVIIGGVFQYAVSQPADIKSWLGVALVALAMGLVPSGLFKFTMQVADRSSDITPVEDKPKVDSGSQ
jgi:hypothetical protein